jgi:hypothetical protein
MKATVAGASENHGSCCEEVGAGAAGTGCGFGAVFFIQHPAPPQLQHLHAARATPEVEDWTQPAGTLCAHTSVRLNRMASSNFTRGNQQ